MLSTEAYYQILGLHPGVSEAEIKAAYKRLAKHWHPDCNASPEAHDTFVQINEACRYLLLVKKEKNPRMHSSQDWHREQQAKAREKAMKDVRMRYEAYIHSDEYKELTAFSVVADFVSAMYMLILLIGLPLFLVGYQFGLKVLWLAVVWVPLVLVVLEKQIGIFGFLRLTKLKDSCKKIIHPAKFIVSVLILANVVVLFRVTLFTVVPVAYLVAMYVLPIVVFLLFSGIISFFYKRLLSMSQTLLWTITLVNILLVYNYIMAIHPRQADYRLLQQQTSTLVVLEDNQLKQYPHIRLFFDDASVFSSRKISYTFANGGLGLPVVVAYRFSK